MARSRPLRPLARIAAAALAALSAQLAGASETLDPRAMDVLRAMSETLSGATTISVRSSALFDAVQPGGIALTVGQRADVRVRRPDRMHARVRRDDGTERQLWFDGERATVLDPAARSYSVVPAAGTKIVEAAGDRIKVAGDILDYADFFLPDDRLTYDEKAFEKRLRKPDEAADLLRKFRERLAGSDGFEPEALDALMQTFVADEGIKIGQVIHAVRVAVTGKAVGFGLFEALAILGRERSLARIDRALARLL